MQQTVPVLDVLESVLVCSFGRGYKEQNVVSLLTQPGVLLNNNCKHIKMIKPQNHSGLVLFQS